MAPDWGENPRPDMWTMNDGESLTEVLLEDTEFGAWIQKSVESYGFRGVPLSYQEARIYHWNQQADRMIGIDNIPPELRVEQVIGEEWMYPNDPRLEQMGRVLAGRRCSRRREIADPAASCRRHGPRIPVAAAFARRGYRLSMASKVLSTTSVTISPTARKVRAMSVILSAMAFLSSGASAVSYPSSVFESGN